LEEIRDGINTMNYNMEQLRNSIDELKGYGLYSSVSDICDKLESVEREINSLKGSTGYDLTDIHSELTDIQSNLFNIDMNTSNL
jgi:division protein CdvB (Snf7/Vps24/ESCRT-III family)